MTDILVTLSMFAEASDEPLRLLKASGLAFEVNRTGKRMTPADVLAAAPDARGIVAGVEPYTDPTLAMLPKLRCISRVGAGVDSIDLAAAERRGIRVLSTPDETVPAVAEHTLALMLGLLRQLPRVDAATKARAWERTMGHLLGGKTVGIVGLGRVGRQVAQLVQAFGADVLASDPRADARWASDHAVALVPLGELLARSDIVSLHATREGTAPLLGRSEIAAMRPGAWLVNTARGELVDEPALAEALQRGKLGGAALDVFAEEPYRGPLCDMPNVVLTPHQATLTHETRAAMETRAVQNLLSHLQG